MDLLDSVCTTTFKGGTMILGSRWGLGSKIHGAHSCATTLVLPVLEAERWREYWNYYRGERKKQRKREKEKKGRERERKRERRREIHMYIYIFNMHMSVLRRTNSYTPTP